MHLSNPMDIAYMILTKHLKLHQLLLHGSFLLIDEELRDLPELVLKSDIATLRADYLALDSLDEGLVFTSCALE